MRPRYLRNLASWVMKSMTTAGTRRTNQRSVKGQRIAYWPAASAGARVNQSGKRKETCQYFYRQARRQSWAGEPRPEPRPERYQARAGITPAGTATQLWWGTQLRPLKV